MHAEFIKDDNGFIWLFYAKNIFMRKSYHEPGILAGAPTKQELQLQAKKRQEDKERAKKQLIEELEKFEKDNFGKDRPHEKAPKKNGKIFQMMNFMGDFYEELKEESGIG